MGGLLPTLRATAQPRREPVSVTIAVFSGRKDPQFVLPEGQQRDQLRAYLKAARPYGGTAKAPPIKPALGYRGILVSNPQAVLGVTGNVAVFKGVIELRADKVTYLIDNGRTLERRLLGQALAAKAIDAKLHAQIVAKW
jgi:hypothetical protein